MKNAKYCLNAYCLYDYRGVEEHLSAMAAQGWRLEKAGNTLWKYRKAEPARVRYAVTYSDSASQFNPGPTEDQQSLAELCAAAGWEKVTDWFQGQIFSTEDEAAVALETDEALRLQNIHRSMKKNFLPSNLVLLLLLLFLARDFLLALVTGDLYGMVKSNSTLFVGVITLPAVCFQLYILGGYYLWRRRSLRSVEDGGPCLPAGRGCRRANAAMWALLAVSVPVYLLMELTGGRRGPALFFLVYLSLIYLLRALVRGTTALLRRWKASKSVNMTLTVVVDMVLAFSLVGGLTYAALHYEWLSTISGSGETYEYRDREWDVHPRQDFPLTLAELTGEEYGHVRRRAGDRGSFFVSEERYEESALLRDGPETAYLSYTIYKTWSPGLQKSLMEDLLEDDPVKFRGMTFFTLRLVPEDPAPWGAEEAYRRYIDEDPDNAWLLVWPDRVVEVVLGDEAPTEAQIALIIARLGPEA